MEEDGSLHSFTSSKAAPTLATVSEVKMDPKSDLEKEGLAIPPGSPVVRDDQLRQRLKKAMGSVGG